MTEHSLCHRIRKQRGNPTSSELIWAYIVYVAN